MTGEPDPRVTALGREVERATRRVDNVELLVRQLAADVTALAEVAADPGEDTGARPVRSWLLADDTTQARADLTDLVEWLGAVYLRYPDAALPSCWLWHPIVVEELWWCRNAHRGAYEGEGASWRDVGDWHDRQRPGVVKRIGAAAGSCELARHVPGGDRDGAGSGVPLAGAADQLATAWTTTNSTPTPTDEQLTEAETYDRAQHQRTNR